MYFALLVVAITAFLCFRDVLWSLPQSCRQDCSRITLPDPFALTDEDNALYYPTPCPQLQALLQAVDHTTLRASDTRNQATNVTKALC